MPQKKRHKPKVNLVDQLIGQPWQVSMFFGVLLFCIARWAFPMMSHTEMFKPVIGLASILGQLFALPFFLASAASYLQQRSRIPQSTKTHEKGESEIFDDWRDPAPPVGVVIPKRSKRVEQWKSTDTTENITTDKSKREPQRDSKNWSLELLRQLEWKRFELVCAEYFRLLGKVPEVLKKGADGGIDVRVFSANKSGIECAIQCKAWSSLVGVKEVRELFGVMAHESAPKGIFMTTSAFTKDAITFASEHSQKIFLIDGAKFISMIKVLPEAKQKQLLDFATEGDYTTPTCASCGIKMVWREKGFWGCRNYPRCNSTLRIKNRNHVT